MEGYVKGTARALRQRRSRGHKVTTDTNAAITGNLKAGLSGAKAGMTRQAARVRSRTQALADRSQKLGTREVRKLDAAEGRAVSRFGATLMAGAADPYQRGLKAGNKAQAGAMKGAIKGAGMVGKSGTTALDIALAGATEAQAGADYYAGAALKERTSEDMKFIAGLRHDISMTRMQAHIAEQAAEADFERQKRLAAFEANLLEKETGTETMGAVKPFVNLLTEITPQVLAWQEENRKLPEEERMSPDEMIAQLEEDGTLRDPNEVAAAQVLVRQLTNSNQPGPDNIIAEVIRSVPGWTSLGRGKKDRLRSYIQRELAAEQARARKLFGERGDQETPKPSSSGAVEGRDEQVEELLADDSISDTSLIMLLKLKYGYTDAEARAAVEGR